MQNVLIFLRTRENQEISYNIFFVSWMDSSQNGKKYKIKEIRLERRNINSLSTHVSPIVRVTKKV